MHHEEDPRTHADRVLAVEEIQWLVQRIWAAHPNRTIEIDRAHRRAINLAGDIIDFLYADAQFMGVSEDRLREELSVRRPRSPAGKLHEKALSKMEVRNA